MQTQLQYFLHQLFQNGEVQVAEKIQPFSKQELTAAALLLETEYERQRPKMPIGMPNFDEKSALWGATFLYRAAQLTLMRDAEEQTVEKELPLIIGKKTPSILYSTDIALRYLPDLFRMAKGLAPDDILVKKIKTVAELFPFSSVGIPIEKTENHPIILNHSALKLAYLDRILAKKDRKRVKTFELEPYLKEYLGEYLEDFWN